VEDFTHLLAVDTAGNTYMWKFSSNNPTAHAAWLAFHDHQETLANKIKQNKAWNPDVKKGTKPKQVGTKNLYFSELYGAIPSCNSTRKNWKNWNLCGI
jgi:hypothetical protein